MEKRRANGTKISLKRKKKKQKEKAKRLGKRIGGLKEFKRAEEQRKLQREEEEAEQRRKEQEDSLEVHKKKMGKLKRKLLDRGPNGQFDYATMMARAMATMPKYEGESMLDEGNDSSASEEDEPRKKKKRVTFQT